MVHMRRQKTGVKKPHWVPLLETSRALHDRTSSDMLCSSHNPFNSLRSQPQEDMVVLGWN